jgi:hypothetical protein
MAAGCTIPFPLAFQRDRAYHSDTLYEMRKD